MKYQTRLFRIHLFTVSCFLTCAAFSRRFPYDFGCCRNVNCSNTVNNDCLKLLDCPSGHYVRKCPGCCDVCEKLLQNTETCWKAMDLGFCRYGKCEPPLICSTNGSCLPPELGEDWGRGDEFQPFVE